MGTHPIFESDFDCLTEKMSFLFGKKKTPAQMMRENQRLLQRAMRDLDRERAAMEKQEQKIIADIKKMAKKNEMGTVKIMAKDLVRTRNTCKKFMLMRANIQGVTENDDDQISACHVRSHERRHTRHGPYEQTNESSSNSKNHAAI